LTDREQAVLSNRIVDYTERDFVERGIREWLSAGPGSPECRECLLSREQSLRRHLDERQVQRQAARDSDIRHSKERERLVGMRLPALAKALEGVERPYTLATPLGPVVGYLVDGLRAASGDDDTIRKLWVGQDGRLYVGTGKRNGQGRIPAGERTTDIATPGVLEALRHFGLDDGLA
jgi:hypothetical protein